MGIHVAPVIREMDNAKISNGTLPNLNSVGYSVTTAQEASGTVNTPGFEPRCAPQVPIGYFYYRGTRYLASTNT